MVGGAGRQAWLHTLAIVSFLSTILPSVLFKSLNVYGEGETEVLVLDEVSEMSGFGTSR